jgi:hypothetical protein
MNYSVAAILILLAKGSVGQIYIQSFSVWRAYLDLMGFRDDYNTAGVDCDFRRLY